MGLFIRFFKRLKGLTSSRGYGRAGLFLIALLLLGALVMHLLERDVNPNFATYGNSLWWAVTTITTVGYGDEYPVTGAGRLLASLVMFGGIGSFGFLAGTLLEELLKRRQGLMKVNLKDHFVICSYNFKAEKVVREISKELANSKVVIVADTEENPLSGLEGVYFVRGDSTKEAVLEMANVSKAKTVIVLADNTKDDQLADAHSVLTTLAVRDLNPSCKVVAESLNPENTHHLEHAGADEIVSIGDFTAKLISRSSLHVGITHLISELMMNNEGNELYSMKAPSHMTGVRFGEAFLEMKRMGTILIGIYSGGRIVINPPSDQVLKLGEYLVYIAERPVLLGGSNQ
ncbi:MAG: potassium channel protein [Firmicutes bacterium]|nr:potassium channel protein [Bacillota bacterium]